MGEGGREGGREQNRRKQRSGERETAQTLQNPKERIEEKKARFARTVINDCKLDVLELENFILQ